MLLHKPQVVSCGAILGEGISMRVQIRVHSSWPTQTMVMAVMAVIVVVVVMDRHVRPCQFSIYHGVRCRVKWTLWAHPTEVSGASPWDQTRAQSA